MLLTRQITVLWSERRVRGKLNKPAYSLALPRVFLQYWIPSIRIERTCLQPTLDQSRANFKWPKRRFCSAPAAGPARRQSTQNHYSGQRVHSVDLEMAQKGMTPTSARCSPSFFRKGMQVSALSPLRRKPCAKASALVATVSESELF